MERANAAAVAMPHAVTLATSSRDGIVSSRTVLLKGYGDGLLVFESEDYSRKGVELASNPRAALTLHWREVHRQVCVTGTAAPLPPETSDEMWTRRGRPNQAASSATREGETIASLEDELALHGAVDALVAQSDPLPRPASYLAYGLSPLTIEFWEGSADRLHRRLFYEREAAGAPWGWRRIQP